MTTVQQVSKVTHHTDKLVIQDKVNTNEIKQEPIIPAVKKRSRDNLNPAFLGQNLEHRHEGLKIAVKTVWASTLEDNLEIILSKQTNNKYKENLNILSHL